MNRFAIPAILALVVSLGLSALPAIAQTPGDHVKVIKVTVQTTHDDKDSDLSWFIEIHDGTTVYGSAEVGSGEVWRNDTTTDLSITLSKSFAYADRQAFKIRVTQKSASKNYGWEGWLSVNGALGDGTVKRLIGRTREFKLGENGNPKHAEFSFE